MKYKYFDGRWVNPCENFRIVKKTKRAKDKKLQFVDFFNVMGKRK